MCRALCVIVICCCIAASALADPMVAQFAATCTSQALCTGPAEDLENRLSLFFDVAQSRVAVTSACARGVAPCAVQWTVAAPTATEDGAHFSLDEVVYLATHVFAAVPLRDNLGLTGVALAKNETTKMFNVSGINVDLTAHPAPNPALNVASWIVNESQTVAFNAAYSSGCVSIAWFSSAVSEMFKIDSAIVSAAIDSSAGATSCADASTSTAFQVTLSCTNSSLRILLDSVCISQLQAAYAVLAMTAATNSALSGAAVSLMSDNTSSVVPPKNSSSSNVAIVAPASVDFASIQMVVFGAIDSAMTVSSEQVSVGRSTMIQRNYRVNATNGCWAQFAQPPILPASSNGSDDDSAFTDFPLVPLSAGVSVFCCLVTAFIVQRRTQVTDYSIPGVEPDAEVTSEEESPLIKS